MLVWTSWYEHSRERETGLASQTERLGRNISSLPLYKGEDTTLPCSKWYGPLRDIRHCFEPLFVEWGGGRRPRLLLCMYQHYFSDIGGAGAALWFHLIAELSHGVWSFFNLGKGWVEEVGGWGCCTGSLLQAKAADTWWQLDLPSCPTHLAPFPRGRAPMSID